jgi:hypothetical protein
MLCVLLGHAWLVWGLLGQTRVDMRANEDSPGVAAYMIEWLSLEPEERSEVMAPDVSPRMVVPRLQMPELAAAAADEPVVSPESASDSPRGFVDWPVEGRKTAQRIVAEQIEAERVAKMFAGPQGTWASLTKRQQSELAKFRWKAGVDGLERDERGNTIYRFNERCVLVNFMFIGCALGAKPPAYGDLFKDMRQYFDEQRLPQTNEGNGREPESMRPPYWSKPLPERER